MDSSNHIVQAGNDSNLDLAEAVLAAEESLEAMRLSVDGLEKATLKRRAERLLKHAEDIKKKQQSKLAAGTVLSPNAPIPQSSCSNSLLLEEPQSSRALPTSEQILLLKSSYIAGSKFSPWKAAPAENEFDLHESKGMFEDKTSLSLSASQAKVFAGWKRPDEALANISNAAGELRGNATMQHSEPIDLVQDVSTDCSVVASMCVGVARRLTKGHPRLIHHILYPWDDFHDCPKRSSNGKYVVRLNFNGCYRQVIIDDRLPTSSTEKVIHVMDRRNPTLLWPALIEKAYLKIRGGYDFPGSNSATDLWILTGWIPEQVFLQSEELDLTRLWSRMWTAFTNGDVLITMGTGKMSKIAEQAMGLVAEHDYAVLDLREVNGQRLMLIKNPWCEGPTWHRMPQRLSENAQQTTAEIEGDDLSSSLLSPRDLLNADAQLAPGTFWMDIDNAAQYYESIYLNWNSALFSYRQDLHFMWDLSNSSSQSRSLHASLVNHPQFSIVAAKRGTVCMLLSRHLQSMSCERDEIDITGFISLSASTSNGRRILLPGSCFEQSNFVDSPQILLKLQDCEAGRRYTILACEQELASRQHTFTISAFSHSKITLELATQEFQHSSSISAAWTRDCAGCNAHSPAYSTNPQFSITIDKPTRLSLLLQADRDQLNVHLKLVHGRGQRVRNVRSRDIILDSSDYRRRCCVATSSTIIEPGSYTIICSTFETQQFGCFDLMVHANEPIHLRQLPREGAGRLHVSHKTGFPSKCTKIMAAFTAQRVCKLYMKGKCSSLELESPTHLTVSLEEGYGSHRRTITSSADKDSNSNGHESAFLEDTDISPRTGKHATLWIVLTRTCIADQAKQQSVDLEIFVDQPNAFTIGDWKSLDD